MSPKNNPRFARLVAEAFSALGVTQAQFADLGGPSDTTLRKIIEGKPGGVSARTLTGLDKAFGWTPGSAARTLAGGDPTSLTDEEAPQPTQGPVPRQLWSLVGDLTARIGASLNAQATLFEWTYERLTEGDRAEHERLATMAADPLMALAHEPALSQRRREPVERGLPDDAEVGLRRMKRAVQGVAVEEAHEGDNEGA